MLIDAVERAWGLIFELCCIRYRLDLIVERILGQKVEVEKPHLPLIQLALISCP